jgi:molybdopterin converting factor small subunit
LLYFQHDSFLFIDSLKSEVRREEKEALKNIVIEKLGPEGHSTLEVDIDNAVIMLADEIARGCMIYCRSSQQRLENEEDIRQLDVSLQEPIRIMVVPPVAGG